MDNIKSIYDITISFTVNNTWCIWLSNKLVIYNLNDEKLHVKINLIVISKYFR